jgi:pimeloyl-ACP methyl ester carboxylesterase
MNPKGTLMDVAIDTHELFTLEGHGVLVRGTYHKPLDMRSGSQSPLNQPSRIGLVFLNSLSIPRTATGDSSVYWADSFAECGYPSFRLDLPGLGDSDGELPVELLDFINAGGYATVTSSKIKELVARFGLRAVVLVGHCAGAVSALFTAAECRESCQGIVMMDSYFHLPQAKRAKVRVGLTNWALQSRVGGALSDVFDVLKRIRLLLRRNAPPGNANLSLLRRWKELATTGLPILLIKAPGRKAPGAQARVGEFDYLKYILELAGRESQVEVKVVEGTDHSFATRLGRAAVRQYTESWLKTHFPLPISEGSDDTLVQSPAVAKMMVGVTSSAWK